jgi:tetratricopeptide (TPR) repeat protein
MKYQQTEEQGKLGQQLSQEAIELAQYGRWEEAVAVNKDIIERFPADVSAYNRLGKASLELGEYSQAEEAYAKALEIDPLNTIAVKNLERLRKQTIGGKSSVIPAEQEGVPSESEEAVNEPKDESGELTAERNQFVDEGEERWSNGEESDVPEGFSLLD